MNRRAFTLIELLVVIAVIAILVGIILPALSQSRQLGRATVCLSNLHTLGSALQMYTDTNEGRMPFGGLGHGGESDFGNAWIYSARREIGNEKVTHCPADESPHWNQPLEEGGRKRRMSYASNIYMEGSIEGREEYNVMTRIKRPSATVFWAELAEKGEFAVSDHVHPETWFASPREFAAREVQLERHLRRANYGMVDGHAEPLTFEATYLINVQQSQFPNLVWDHNKWDPSIGW